MRHAINVFRQDLDGVGPSDIYPPKFTVTLHVVVQKDGTSSKNIVWDGFNPIGISDNLVFANSQERSQFQSFSEYTTK